MLRTMVARVLEEGRSRGRATELVSRAVATFAAPRLARPASVPRWLRTVCVGGATLGGSGKSRVAVSIARYLSIRGASVVLVGHAYRAQPGRARVVEPTDALEEVGDEARVSAAELEHVARVVVAPTRTEAVSFAAALAPAPEVLVLDGPLQLAPVRATMAVLAVDAYEPWGSGAVVPAGDLRASVPDLCAQADFVVPVDAMPRGAKLGDDVLDLAALRSMRLGLFTAIARPQRLVSALRRAGIVPVLSVEAPDHGPAPASAGPILGRVGEVDAWLSTAKCAVHLDPDRLGAPIATLDGSLALPADVRARLDALSAAAPEEALFAEDRLHGVP